MKKDLEYILSGNLIIIAKEKSYNSRRNKEINYNLTIILLQHGILKRLMMDYYMLEKEFRLDDGFANMDKIKEIIDNTLRYPMNISDDYYKFKDSFYEIKKTLQRKRKLKKLNNEIFM